MKLFSNIIQIFKFIVWISLTYNLKHFSISKEVMPEAWKRNMKASNAVSNLHHGGLAIIKETSKSPLGTKMHSIQV